MSQEQGEGNLTSALLVNEEMGKLPQRSDLENAPGGFNREVPGSGGWVRGQPALGTRGPACWEDGDVPAGLQGQQEMLWCPGLRLSS